MIEQLILPKMRRRKPNPPTGDDLKRRGIERALLNERARRRQQIARGLLTPSSRGVARIASGDH